jgi:hypothetical protein
MLKRKRDPTIIPGLNEGNKYLRVVATRLVPQMVGQKCTLNALILPLFRGAIDGLISWTIKQGLCTATGSGERLLAVINSRIVGFGLFAGALGTHVFGE